MYGAMSGTWPWITMPSCAPSAPIDSGTSPPMQWKTMPGSRARTCGNTAAVPQRRNLDAATFHVWRDGGSEAMVHDAFLRAQRADRFGHVAADAGEDDARQPRADLREHGLGEPAHRVDVGRMAETADEHQVAALRERCAGTGDVVQVGQDLHARGRRVVGEQRRSEEQTSELQSLMSTSYAVFCLQKKTNYMKNEQ